jgi:hypothetical protein
MNTLIKTIVPCMALALPVAAADRPPVSKFDKDKSGNLNKAEFARYAAAIFEPKLKEVDADEDGLVTETELLGWAEKHTFDTDFNNGATTITFVNAQGAVPPEDEKPWSLAEGRLRIRKDHDSLILPKFKDADPANATFYRNNGSHEDTWAIEAALGWVDELAVPVEGKTFLGYELDPLRYVISAGINRIDGIGAGDLKDTDAMAFRGGLILGLRGTDSTLFGHHLISVAYRGTTDTHLDDYTHGVEVTWQPMLNHAGFIGINGPYRPVVPDLASYRFTFVPKLEAGETPEGATGAGESFLKIGPTTGISLLLGKEKRLEAFANYGYRWELGGHAEDFDYWELGARYALDDAEHIYLEGKYRLGTTPDKYTPIDVTQFGLGVKF